PQADAHGSDADAAAREDRRDVGESFAALAKHVLRRHRQTLEAERGGIRAREAELLLRLAPQQTLGLAIDDEGADATGARLSCSRVVRPGDHHVRAAD